MKYTRTEKGMAFSQDENKADEAVLFGVRPCDAHSFVLLDMLFDQEKYKDDYYVAKRQKTTVISLACVQASLCNLLLYFSRRRTGVR